MHHPFYHKVLQPPSRRYSYPSLAGISTPDTETPLLPYTQAPHTRCTHILRYTQAPTTMCHPSFSQLTPTTLAWYSTLHPHIHLCMFSFLPIFFFYDRSWKKIKRLATRWPQPRKWFGAYVCIHRAHLIILFLTSVVALHLVPFCTPTPIAFIFAVDTPCSSLHKLLPAVMFVLESPCYIYRFHLHIPPPHCSPEPPSASLPPPHPPLVPSCNRSTTPALRPLQRRYPVPWRSTTAWVPPLLRPLPPLCLQPLAPPVHPWHTPQLP